MTAKLAAKKSPWANTRDRDTEREEKMEALLIAAAEAFSENGYRGTSLESIAARLGITKPTLYHYCSSKEDLVMRVSDRGLNLIMQTDALDQHASGLDQLQQLLRHYAQWIAGDFGKTIVMLNKNDLSEANGAIVTERSRMIDRRIRALISKGVADGTIAPCDPRLTSFMLASAINGIARWYKKGAGLSPSALAEIYVNQMTNGLKPRG